MRAKISDFLGSKGGVGTTTLAVNIAVLLAQELVEDQHVVLADMRSGMATTSLQLGLRRHSGLARLLEQPVEQIEERKVEAQLEKHVTGMLVLSGQIEPLGVATSLSPAHAEVIVRQLGNMADYLLLDLGVGLSEANRRILPRCHRIVVTLEPHRMAITLMQALLDEMIQSLDIASHKIDVVLINKTRGSTFTKGAIEDLLQHELAGVVTPAPELAFQSSEKDTPMVMMQPQSLVAQQIRAIAEHLAEARV